MDGTENSGSGGGRDSAGAGVRRSCRESYDNYVVSCYDIPPCDDRLADAYARLGRARVKELQDRRRSHL
jgi:hypothetical protein